MNRRISPLVNKLLILFSLLLGILLAGFLFWNRKTEQHTALQLQQMEALSEDGSEDSDAADPGVETGAEVETIKPDETEGENETQTEDVQDDTEGVTDTDMVQGLSFRGDSFGSEEDNRENGICAQLAKILEENGQELAVEDYSMDVAGTLSQMKLSGVAQSDLDMYLEKHVNEANGKELRITETKIRDLMEEDMIRSDQSYIPIICMGYYGGWGNDLDELCEQQQKILNTYQESDRYLILGVYPTGFSDRDAYREKMESRWGEHFIMLSDEVEHMVSSAEGKKEIAQILYDKLTELGYLS